LIKILEPPRRRHVGGVAARRSGVDPFRDGGDLLVGQRGVVLELGDADVAIDVPTSSYVRSAIGATAPGRWQVWHERWRIGATSLVNVTGVWLAAGALCWAAATPAMARKARTVGIVRTIASSSEDRESGRPILADGGPTVNNQFGLLKARQTLRIRRFVRLS
jgi:hypothetical protein